MKFNLKKAAGCLGFWASLAAFSTSAQVTGPSTGVVPYIEAMTTNVAFTSVFTAGDTVNLKPDGVTPYRFVGIPDGLGAFDNNDGTFTLLMNHELGTSAGVTRAHGAKGAFVSKWNINKATLAVNNVSDLITNLWLLDTNTYSYVSTAYAMGRLCSADLPAVGAFYNATSGYGTTNRIFLSGEESAPANARAFAHVVTGPEAQNSYDLPWLGKMSWENVVACPAAQNKTIVGCMDDDGTTDSQVYFWVGNKTNSGMEIVKAGLVNGSLYGVSVSGLAQEVSGTTAATRNFALVNLSALENIIIVGSQRLEDVGNTNGVTSFMRGEDGAWDPTHPNDYYFNTTASAVLPSRLWRLRFTDITQPELGGVCDLMLDGTEGQLMLDNLCADANGNIIENEDPGNNARLSRISKYYPATDAFVPLGQAKTNYFLTGGANFITQDEEVSGVMDASSILGAGKYLFVAQIHSSAPVSGDAELAEGGQLIMMQTIFPAQLTGPSTAVVPYIEAMTTNVAFTSVFTAGDTVNLKPDGVTPYRFVGIPDGLGAFDNNDGTFTLLMNHELGTSAGVTRAHGAKGAFVSKWNINKATLAVNNVSDLITNLWLLDTNTYSYVSTAYAMGRLCSADLPAVGAFYNATSGYGTTNRIFLSGEESAPANARAFAHVVTGPEAQNSYDLPWLGKMSWENVVACPAAQNKTIVGCMDDDGTTDSQVYFWVGNKTNSGMEIVKAGLVNGSLYGVSVSGLAQEVSGTTAATRNFALVNLSALENIIIVGSQRLEDVGNTNGVTSFMRGEDGAWDPTHPNDYYFNTTASAVLPSRLWRLRFTDITQPELGGVCDLMLDGTEGQLMLDNLCADANGNIIENEDPGNNARLSRISKYYPATDAFVPLGQAKTNYFLTGGANFITQDEEVSGVMDASSILGAGKYLFVAQIHSSAPVSGDAELAEGGQLIMMQTYAGLASNGLITGQPTSSGVTPGGNAVFTVTMPAGSWVQWYFNGKPIAGATGATLTVSNVGSSTVGSYYAVVGNSSGSVVSSTATLSTTSIALYAGITVNGPVGSSYTIQYTASLSGTPVWNTLGTLTLTSSAMIYLDTTAPANQAQRFYRAVLQ